jgi:hypothetical protein
VIKERASRAADDPPAEIEHLAAGRRSTMDRPGLAAVFSPLSFSASGEPRMKKVAPLLAALVLLALPLAAGADQRTQSVSGLCTEGDIVSFNVTIDFTATGGDFGAGTGTATVKFTLENTSGVNPPGGPGNPVQTGFFFNVPPTSGVTFAEARVLAGASLVEPGGCRVLVADEVHTEWYALDHGQATGQYGIFSAALEPELGINYGWVDPDVVLGCVEMGPVYASRFVSGKVQFIVDLTHLGVSLMSAGGFLNICSVVQGMKEPSWVAGKFQGTGYDGGGSCFIGQECPPTPTRATTWGAMKSIYR